MKNTFFIMLFGLAAIQAKAQDCECQTLSGNLSTQTLENTDCYELSGCVRVPNGVTLTIDDGTMIYPGANSALIIEKGGNIVANGTSNSPIVFIPKFIANRSYGYWEGIVIAGEANNRETSNDLLIDRTCDIEAGGSTNNDNSGSMNYVQLHYSAHGLTLASVGSGTTIDHVQSTFSGTDGFQFIGGTVEASNLISYNAKRNDFRITNGYTGSLQFLLGLRKDINAFDAAGSQGILVVNEGTQSTPVTRPVISNATLIGPNLCGSPMSSSFRDAIRIGDGASAGIYNSYAGNWEDYGFFLDGSTTIAKTSTDLFFSYNSVDNTGLGYYNHSGSWTGCETTMGDWIEPLSPGTCTQTDNEFATLAPYNSTSICSATANPDLKLTGTLMSPGFASVSELDNNAFFDQVAFRGAFADDVDWSDGWSDFTPGVNDYCETAPMKQSGYENNGLELVPNPAHAVTAAQFTTSKAGTASLTVVSAIDGATLMSQSIYLKEAGKQKVEFNTSVFKAGVYMVSIETADRVFRQYLMIE